MRKRQKDLAPILNHDSSLPMSLGCSFCPERELCGGLQISGPQFNCLAFCQCTDKSKCTLACPNNPSVFVQRIQEVDGFDLRNIPSVPRLAYPRLPSHVPIIYHNYRRETALKAAWIAVPLAYVLDRKTGAVRFQNREELAATLGFATSARLILVGADRDDRIEDYWKSRRIADIPNNLRKIQPDLITTPNFSLPLDVIRHDNMHNMKRIALVWSELVTSGIPTSLHLNARTDHDWYRWTEFAHAREEVCSVSFEFATGAKRAPWGRWYVEKLVSFAKGVGRPLDLLVRGGYPYLRTLGELYRTVTFIDSSSFMKTMKRKRLDEPNAENRPVWVDSRTDQNEALDSLLADNVKLHAALIARN